jgi:hypothetical protein
VTDGQRDELTGKLRANPRFVEVPQTGGGMILPGARPPTPPPEPEPPTPDPEPVPEPPLTLDQRNL